MVPEALPVYCATGAEHSDNARFMADCEVWLGRTVTVLRSDQYADTWEVWERRRYMAGIAGSPCTTELKVAPRLTFQKPYDVHVFGYTADRGDQRRAERLRENYPELTIRTPLIDAGITKAGCLAIVENAGIALPPLYALGFPCNNCIPCVKATSPAYWALVRQHFPAEFDRAAKLSRRLKARLARLGGDRVFIDQIPMDQPTTEPIQPHCDFLCQAADLETTA
jgi:hypothetical protein